MENNQQNQGNYQQFNQSAIPPYQEPIRMPDRKPPINGLGIAGMIIGIIAVLCSCTIAGAIIGAIGLVLSICGFIPKHLGKGMAIAGTALNSVALIFSLIIFIYNSYAPSDDAIKVSEIFTSEENISIESKSDDVTKEDAKVEAYSVGSVIETNDTKISYLSCNVYEEDNEYLLPKEGYEYITAEFEFENTGKSDSYVTSWDFECYADGYSVEQSFVNNDNELSATISSGRKAKGTITFEVPVDAQEIVIEYSSNMFSSKKIKFIVK